MWGGGAKDFPLPDWFTDDRLHILNFLFQQDGPSREGDRDAGLFQGSMDHFEGAILDLQKVVPGRVNPIVYT